MGMLARAGVVFSTVDEERSTDEGCGGRDIGQGDRFDAIGMGVRFAVQPGRGEGQGACGFVVDRVGDLEDDRCGHR